MKILLVDDKPENLYLLETILKESNYDVMTAGNGVEALKKLKENSIDIIISDILMPRMDGFQLCRTCKTDDQLKSIPFVFYTATYTDKKDEEFALSLGAEKFIIKPIEPDKFLKILEGVIEDYKKRVLIAPIRPIEEEAVYLTEYNKRLIKKLEKRMQDMGRANKELRESEKSLRASEHFLSSILESIQDGISILDTDLTIRHVNNTTNMWYIQNIPLVGKKCYECYHNRSKPCKPCPSLRCIKSGKLETNIVAGIAGSPAKWIELFSYPMKDPDSGEVTGVVEFVRDITKRKQAEEELKKYKDLLEKLVEQRTAELRESIAELKNFSRSVSHDLSAPPQAMDSNINRKDIQLAQVSLEQIIEEVLEQLKPEIEEKGAEVTVDRPLPKATGHHSILLQSVTNLVRNALKFESSGVRPQIRIWAEERDNYIRLWIKDNGICVSPEHQELIFRLFEHLHGSETYSGIGVGLAIINRGIMRMGGRFGFESTLGKRSSFYIELPI